MSRWQPPKKYFGRVAKETWIAKVKNKIVGSHWAIQIQDDMVGEQKAGGSFKRALEETNRMMLDDGRDMTSDDCVLCDGHTEMGCKCEPCPQCGVDWGVCACDETSGSEMYTFLYNGQMAVMTMSQITHLAPPIREWVMRKAKRLDDHSV